jgi:hypothetical protein
VTAIEEIALRSARRVGVLGALMLILWSVPAPAQEAVIGHVRSVDGVATVTHGPVTWEAAPGAAVYEGDVLQTYLNGTMGVTFKDNTRISLGPSTRVTIPKFVFSPSEQHYGFVLRLIAGSLQYLSGLTAKLSPDSMKIETPTATVGVRGTRLLARAEP